MTDGNPTGGADARSRLEVAEADLAELRERLMAAGRGDASAADVKDSFRSYLAAHGPTIRETAASLAEEVRRQTLEELYKWRAQLAAQLPPGERKQPPEGS